MEEKGKKGGEFSEGGGGAFLPRGVGGRSSEGGGGGGKGPLYPIKPPGKQFCQKQKNAEKGKDPLNNSYWKKGSSKANQLKKKRKKGGGGKPPSITKGGEKEGREPVFSFEKEGELEKERDEKGGGSISSMKRGKGGELGFFQKRVDRRREAEKKGGKGPVRGAGTRKKEKGKGSER